MRIPYGGPDKILRLLTIALLLIIALWGTAMVCFQIRPFWIDEWRLILNLKFKSPEALWGPLDFTQQFPRVFLQLLKAFTNAFDYSYCSLRFPSFIIAVLSMVLCWRLMKRLFPQPGLNRWLFVLVLVSSQTFTDYLVQIKQYEMEIFLSLVAIWQLLEITAIKNVTSIRPGRYMLLCLSLMTAPFFSYTYPIAITPVYLIVLLQLITVMRAGLVVDKRTWLQMFPLLLGAAAIIVFYLIDVSQLMSDPDMHRYWEYRMIGRRFDLAAMAANTWGLFAKVGSGLLFEIIFGILGITAFGYGLGKYLRKPGVALRREDTTLLVYSLFLLLVVIVLFLTGKLPAGEPKFNAFTVAAISLLIIHLLDVLAGKPKWRRYSVAVSVMLYLGLTGNILSTIVNSVTGETYQRRMRIYHATEQAISLAQRDKLPILVTQGVAYPDDINRFAPFLAPVSAAQVLQTFPAYPADASLPVYSVGSLDSISATVTRERFVAGDGMHYQVFPKK